MYSRKIASKFIAILLSAVFLFPLSPSPVFAVTEDPVDPTVVEGIVTETGEGESTESENAEPSAAEEPYIIGEVSALREESVKQYRMSDGQLSKAVYSEPIHFERDGQWADIDNRLLLTTVDENGEAYDMHAIASDAEKEKIKEGRGEYRNAANSFDLRLAKDADQNDMVSLSEGDYSVSFSALYDPADYLRQWQGEEGEAAASARKLASEVKEVSPPEAELKADPYRLARTESELVYKDVNEGVDFQYIPTNTGVKENIIVKSPQEQGYEYSFALSLTGLGARLNKAGEIELYDAANPETIKYIFPAPFMYDAGGEESYDVSYELKEAKDFATLREGLTPAIEAAGQQAVFSEIDGAAEPESEPAEESGGATEPEADGSEEPEEQGEPPESDGTGEIGNPDSTGTPAASGDTNEEPAAEGEPAGVEQAEQNEAETQAVSASEGESGSEGDVNEEPAGGGETPAPEEPLAEPEEGNEDGTEPGQNEEGEETAEPPAVDETAEPETGAPAEEEPAVADETPETKTSAALNSKLEKEKLYIFTVKADRVWIETGSRAFPVTIDPVLSRMAPQENVLGNYSFWCSHYVNEDGIWYYDYDHALNTGWKHVGRSANGKEYYSALLDYASPADFAGPAVISATLRVRTNDATRTKQIALVQQGDWDMDGGGDHDFIIDFARTTMPTAENPQPITSFDITKLFANNTEPSLSLEIVPLVATYPSYTNVRFSTVSAFLVIKYRDINGLEDYWTTHTQSVGRAGIGNINDYTGQLTFVHDDVSTPGGRMPASIQHVYNSEPVQLYDYDQADNYAGNAWRLNYDQTLTIPVGEADTASYPYVWMDSDGTRHFFRKADVKYFENGAFKTVTGANGAASDEDGLGLYVVPVSNTTLKATYPYKITDTSGSLNMYFDKGGYLALIRDANQKENGTNKATKEKNQIEIIRSETIDGNVYTDNYGELLWIIEGYIEWISDDYMYNGDAEWVAYRNEYLAYNYLVDLYTIQTIEENDPYIRVDKTILGKLNTVKENLRYLTQNPAVARATRLSKLNACRTALEQIQARCLVLMPLIYSRITQVKDAAGVTIDIAYYSSGISEGKIRYISDPRRNNENIAYGYDSAGNLTSITYPPEDGATQGKISTYGYAGRLLSSAEDSSDYRVNYHGESLYTNYGRYLYSSVTHVSESAGAVSGQAYSIEHGMGSSTYTFSGEDDLLGSSVSDPAAQDDISTTYIFDARGRTTSSYSTFADGELLGGGAYEYIDAADTSHNKIKQSANSGTHTENHLINHSFERSGAGSNWYKYNNFTGAGNSVLHTAAFDKASPLIGVYEAKVAGAAAFQGGTQTAPKVSGYAQQLTLAAGEYTFSGYVKTSGLSEGAAANLRIVKGSTSPLDGLIGTSDQSTPVTQNTTVLSTTDVPSTTVSGMNNGWVRLSLSFSLSQETEVFACAELRNSTAGAAYFDCFQLEEGDVANTYNILEDASFEHAEGDSAGSPPWTYNNGGGDPEKNGMVSEYSPGFAMDGYKTFSIWGELAKNKYLRTPLNVGSANASYVLSGWIYLYAVSPVKSGRTLGLEITCPQNTAAKITKNLYVPTEDEWLYFSVPMPRGNWSGSTLSFKVNNVTGYIDIDDLQLVRKDITKAEYKSGNMTKKTVGSETTTYTYGSSRLVTSVTSPSGQKINYSYDITTNDLRTQKEVVGSVTTTVTYSYDKYGNQIKEKTTNSSNSVNFISSAAYTGDGRFLSYSIDGRGSRTDYEYDTVSGELLSAEEPGNSAGATVETVNTYGDIGQVTSVTSGGKTVDYTYSEADEMTGVSHNGFDYSFEYDVFGSTEEIAVAGQSLISHEYAEGNGKLLETSYGNGFSIEPVYNEREQQVSEIWTQATAGAPITETAYEVLYDNEGKTAAYYDRLNDLRYEYDYDAVGRPRRQFAYDETTGDKLYETESAYTDAGLPLSLYYGIGQEEGDKYTYRYETDGRPKSIRFPSPSEAYRGYTYDAYKRLTKELYYPVRGAVAGRRLATDVTYIAGNTDTANGGAASATTSLVKTFKNTIGTSVKNNYTYTYTGLGNIRTVKDMLANKTTTYHYNDLSYLTREDNEALGKTTVYEYDGGGNILMAKEYAYQTGVSVTGTPTSTRTYTYRTTGWKDQLTGYDGGQGMQDIVYDNIGNPTEYLGRELTWQYGRKLMSIDGGSASISDDVSFAYGTDGTRLSKTAGAQTTEYIYIGGSLVRERSEDYELNYYYDANGALTSIGHKAAGATAEVYYFVTRNLQGDIMALYNTSNSSLVGTYTYDTWGKVTSVKDATGTDVSGDDTHILNLNPFRYRGYYLDSETGFYYLQSRYYDPETRRFLNADGLISTGTGVTGYNMYMYCNNNPVNGWDPTGMCTWTNHGWIGHKVADCGSFSCPSSSCYGQTFGAGQGYGGVGAAPPTTPPPPSTSLAAPTTNYNPNNVVHSTDGDFCTLPGCTNHAGGNVHLGADILGDASTGLIASHAGSITTGYSDGQGYYFEIISWDETVITQYQHCTEDVLALENSKVSAGQHLGNYMGASGFVINVDRILHFEVRINGKVVNPLKYIR